MAPQWAKPPRSTHPFNGLVVCRIPETHRPLVSLGNLERSARSSDLYMSYAGFKRLTAGATTARPVP